MEEVLKAEIRGGGGIGQTSLPQVKNRGNRGEGGYVVAVSSQDEKSKMWTKKGREFFQETHD